MATVQECSCTFPCFQGAVPLYYCGPNVTNQRMALEWSMCSFAVTTCLFIFLGHFGKGGCGGRIKLVVVSLLDVAHPKYWTFTYWTIQIQRFESRHLNFPFLSLKMLHLPFRRLCHFKLTDGKFELGNCEVTKLRTPSFTLMFECNMECSTHILSLAYAHF